MHFSARDYQVKAIHMMTTQPYALMALRMGFGKTVCTLTAIDSLINDQFVASKALVVAPKRVAEMVWDTETVKWDHLQSLSVQKVLGSAKERLQSLSKTADVYVINRENFAWLVELWQTSKQPWPFDTVVLDENIGFKNRASKAWKALKAVRKHISRLFILTGTPDPNGTLEDLWPQISILDQGQRLGKSLTAYRDEFYRPDKRNGHVIYSYKLKPGARERIHAAVADVMLSVDTGVVLPERVDNVVQIDFDRRRYDELEREAVSDTVMAQNAAVLVGKLAQMANGAVYDQEGNVVHIHDAKVDALREIVDQGEPVLCFTQFIHDQDRIKAAIPEAEVFEGGYSLQRWKAGKTKLLLMHPKSGGHGVDGLQDAGSVIVWFGLPYSLDAYQQANARLHRSGQSRGVVVHHLLARNTIDETIFSTLQSKGDMQQALLDAVKALSHKHQ